MIGPHHLVEAGTASRGGRSIFHQVLWALSMTMSSIWGWCAVRGEAEGPAGAQGDCGTGAALGGACCCRLGGDHAADALWGSGGHRGEGESVLDCTGQPPRPVNIKTKCVTHLTGRRKRCRPTQSRAVLLLLLFLLLLLLLCCCCRGVRAAQVQGEQHILCKNEAL